MVQESNNATSKFMNSRFTFYAKKLTQILSLSALDTRLFLAISELLLQRVGLAVDTNNLIYKLRSVNSLATNGVQ